MPKEIRQVINEVERKFDFGYDDGGRRTALQYFIGDEGVPAMETAYGYDRANRLLNIQHLQSTNILEDLLYEYAANGNRTKFTRNADQTSRSDSASPSCATKTYTFDVRNRLVGISGFDNQCAPLSAGFSYDALGRRIEKTVNGVTTQYVYDGMDIIQEIQGGLTTNYIRTLNIDEPLVRINADGTIRHYKSDALGSIIALTDDTGNVTTTYTYDPFGNTTISGENSDNPFQYTGRENDGTGLYYYRARYYSPELQRFINEDPIGLAGGINLYAYVQNNPVNYVDPRGLAVGPPIFPPGLPQGGLPGTPGAPDAPGSDEPGPGACRWVEERYCEYQDLFCPWETTTGDKCFVKNLDKCHCLRWSYRPVYKCGNKVIFR